MNIARSLRSSEGVWVKVLHTIFHVILLYDKYLYDKWNAFVNTFPPLAMVVSGELVLMIFQKRITSVISRIFSSNCQVWSQLSNDILYMFWRIFENSIISGVMGWGYTITPKIKFLLRNDRSRKRGRVKSLTSYRWLSEHSVSKYTAADRFVSQLAVGIGICVFFLFKVVNSD